MVTTAELQLFKDAKFDIYRNMSNFASLSAQNSYYNSLSKLDYDIVFNKIGDPFTIDVDIASLSEYTTGRINYAGIWWYFQILDMAVNAQGQTTVTYQLNAWETHRYQGNVRLGAGQIERRGTTFDYQDDSWNPLVENARYWKIEDATDRDNSTVVLGTNSAPCILAMYRDNDNDWIYPVCLKLVQDDANYILTNTSAFAHYIIDAMKNVFANGELLGMWYSSFYPTYSGPWTATGTNRVYYYNIMNTSERDINDMRISLIFDPEELHQQGYVHNTETEQFYIADERGNVVYRMADGCIYDQFARMILNMSLTSCQWIGTVQYQNERDSTYCTDYFEIACEPLDFYNDSWSIYQSQQRQTDIDARSLNTQNNAVSSLTSIGSSALGGAVVGSVVPGIGTAVGAVAGLITGTVGALATTLYDYGYANNKEQSIIDASYKKASDNICYQGNGVNGAMLFWSNDCKRTGYWASCGAGLKKRTMDAYTANLISNDENVYGCYVNIITDDVDSEIEDGPFLAYCEVLGIPSQWAGQIQERLSNGVLFSKG